MVRCVVRAQRLNSWQKPSLFNSFFFQDGPPVRVHDEGHHGDVLHPSLPPELRLFFPRNHPISLQTTTSGFSTHHLVRQQPAIRTHCLKP